MKQLLAVFLLLCAWPVLAQNMSFEGCMDAKGQPVAGLADDQLPRVAQFGLADGKAVIWHNPQVLPRLLLETRLFVLAHECGRQHLGFAPGGERTLMQARQADCWAYGALKKSVLASPQILAAVEEDIGMSADDWALLPGPAREMNLASCGAAPGSAGSLKLPTGPARDKWNVCQQGCGAKLYSCGREAACEAAFSQCSAACGK
jgi:hypothetical protein